jgi:hypothetical protein
VQSYVLGVVREWGVSHATLEDVFIEVAKRAGSSVAAAESGGGGGGGGGGGNDVDGNNERRAVSFASAAAAAPAAAYDEDDGGDEEGLLSGGGGAQGVVLYGQSVAGEDEHEHEDGDLGDLSGPMPREVMEEESDETYEEEEEEEEEQHMEVDMKSGLTAAAAAAASSSTPTTPAGVAKSAGGEGSVGVEMTPMGASTPAWAKTPGGGGGGIGGEGVGGGRGGSGGGTQGVHYGQTVRGGGSGRNGNGGSGGNERRMPPKPRPIRAVLFKNLSLLTRQPGTYLTQLAALINSVLVLTLLQEVVRWALGAEVGLDTTFFSLFFARHTGLYFKDILQCRYEDWGYHVILQSKRQLTIAGMLPCNQSDIPRECVQPCAGGG